MRAMLACLHGNANKTQMLCISPALHANVKTYIKANADLIIEDQESLKILGFIFGQEPSVNAQMEAITLKY